MRNHGKVASLVNECATNCNNLTYISSINTWASGDSPLAQLVKELDLFETQQNQSIISPFPLHGVMPKDPSLSKPSG